MNRTGLAVAISLVAGFCVWVGLSVAAGVREAWDEPIYWWLGLPVLAIVAGLTGYIAPMKVWRWPTLIALSQIVAMLAVNPGAGLGLLPLALMFVLLPLVVVLTIPALIGGSIARGGWNSALLA
jgi:hypothetical protein